MGKKKKKKGQIWKFPANPGIEKFDFLFDRSNYFTTGKLSIIFFKIPG
jgi:hypothetical protein